MAFSGLLQPLSIPTKVWIDISWGFNSLKGFFFLAKENVFVTVNPLNKYAHFTTISHPFIAMDITQMFMDNVFKFNVMPKS